MSELPLSSRCEREDDHIIKRVKSFEQVRLSLGPVVNILAIFLTLILLILKKQKKQENKKIPHQTYRLSVIDFD